MGVLGEGEVGAKATWWIDQGRLGDKRENL